MNCPPAQRFALTTVLLVGLTATASYAQPQIPNTVVGAQSTPSAANQQVIVNYVQHWLKTLEGSDHAKRSEARQKLVDPMRNSNGTAIFKRAYSTEVSQRLGAAMGRSEVHIRLNAAIIAASLIDARVFDTIVSGLTDDNPGVRYWSAKALRQVLAERAANGSNPVVPAPQLGSLLGALTGPGGAMVTEREAAVFNEQLLAAGQLPDVDAKVKTLQALQQRIAMRAQSPAMSVQPLLNGLPPINLQLAQADAAAVAEPLRQLALTAYRYLALSTTLLEAGRAGDQADQYAQLAVATNNMLLQAALSNGVQDTGIHGRIKSHLAADQWRQAKQATLGDWRTVLSSPPFGFRDAELVAVKLPDAE